MVAPLSDLASQPNTARTPHEFLSSRNPSFGVPTNVIPNPRYNNNNNNMASKPKEFEFSFKGYDVR